MDTDAAPLRTDRFPFLRLFLPLAVGITLQHLLNCESRIAYAGAATGAIGLIVFRLSARTPSFRYACRNLFGFSLSVLLCCAGMTLYRLQNRTTPLPDPHRYSVLTGQVAGDPVWGPKSVSFTTQVETCTDTAGRIFGESIPVRLYFRTSDTAYRLRRGDRLSWQNRLAPISNQPGAAFDYAGYMARQGIRYAQFVPEDAWKLLPNTAGGVGGTVTRWRSRALETLRNSGLGPDEAALLATLLLGYRSDLSPTQRTDFSDTGLGHMLAVSGLHVGIVAALLFGLFRPLRRLWKDRLRTLPVLAGVWGYVFFCGAAPSALRAAVMATFVFGGRLFGRRNYSFNSLAAAAFFICLFDPNALFDPGFQLSFVAVASILALYAPLQSRVAAWPPLARGVAELSAITAVVQAGTLLLGAYYFRTIPLAALMVNLLAIPLLPVAMSGGILLLAAAPFGGLPPLLLWLENGVLRWLVLVPAGMRNRGWGIVRDAEVSPAVLWIGFGIVWCALLWWRTRKKIYGIACGVLASVAAGLVFI